MKQQHTKLWEQRYERSRTMLRAMIEQDVPKVMIRDEARLLLQACYRGPWRAIWALVRHEAVKAWYRHVGGRYARIRARVFGRIPDPVMEIADRVTDEDKELERMLKEL